MDKLKLAELINKEIRINYKSKVEFAKILGIKKQNLTTFIKNLEKEKDAKIDRICKILSILGYELQIKKKGK
jgi:hypothetical protein|nr:MAG TPA: repressor protein C2 [Caudoviricetes sp.]